MVLLAAPRHDGPPTGGYRYNRMIASALQEERLRRCEINSPAELAGLPDRAGLSAEDAVLADSLFFTAPGAVEALRAGFDGGLWMLVHYLPSLDPTLTRERAEELRGMEERCLRSCGGAVTTGVFTEKVLRERPGAPERVLTVTPGLDRRFVQAGQAGKRSGEPVRMLTAANWTPLKNHAALLPVLEQLREYSWQWRILGDCGEEPQLCRRFSEEAEERGFGERVELWGAVTLEATAREMGAADIYLSPSLLESYGMSVAEAMAAGCAVLAADSGGTAELIRHGEDGLLCGAEDAAQWREALERLLREPEERRRLGDAARQRAAGFPAWQEQAAKLLAAIEEVRSG